MRGLVPALVKAALASLILGDPRFWNDVDTAPETLRAAALAASARHEAQYKRMQEEAETFRAGERANAKRSREAAEESARGGGGGVPGSTGGSVADAWWGEGAGARVALFIGLAEPEARTAPPAAARVWPQGDSLAHVLLDPSLWAVDKLEDEVLVIFYARRSPAATTQYA